VGTGRKFLFRAKGIPYNELWLIIKDDVL